MGTSVSRIGNNFVSRMGKHVSRMGKLDIAKWGNRLAEWSDRRGERGSKNSGDLYVGRRSVC